MKFVIHLCLILSTIQLSVAKRTGEILQKYSGQYISVRDIDIPSNSLWRGTKREFVESDSYSGYNWLIHYLHEIPNDSPIRVIYVVQYEEENWLWNSWETQHTGSILLCDRTKGTQDASILALVRQILNISRGCLSKESTAFTNGQSKRPSHVSLFKGKFLLLKSKIRAQKIRIFINIWHESSAPVQHLFIGTLYYDNPSPYV